MKKLIFLLFPFFMLAQNPTNFPYGIKNTVAPSNSTPSYFVTQEVDGVHKKTPAALIAKTATVNDSLATKENVANKQNSLAFDGTGLKYPTVRAVNDGLSEYKKGEIVTNKPLSDICIIEDYFDISGGEIVLHNSTSWRRSNLIPVSKIAGVLKTYIDTFAKPAISYFSSDSMADYMSSQYVATENSFFDEVPTIPVGATHFMVQCLNSQMLNTYIDYDETYISNFDFFFDVKENESLVVSDVWTEAIQEALNSYDYVYIPYKETPYLIDRTLILKSGAYLKIHPKSVIKAIADIPLILNKNLLALTPDEYITLDGGIFDQDSLGGTGVYGTGRAIGFFGVDNLTIKNVTVINPGMFALQINTAKYLKVDNIHFNSITSDGLHLGGDISNFNISNISGTAGDDLVALNAWDWRFSSPRMGDIINGRISNIYGKASQHLVRLLGANQDGTDYIVDNIVIDNVRGFAGTSVFDIGYQADPDTITTNTPTKLGNINISNVDAWAGYDMGVKLSSDIAKLSFTNCEIASAVNNFIKQSASTTIDNLTIDGFNFDGEVANFDNPAILYDAFCRMEFLGTVKNLAINNSWFNADDTSNTFIKALNIENFTINSTRVDRQDKFFELLPTGSVVLKGVGNKISVTSDITKLATSATKFDLKFIGNDFSGSGFVVNNDIGGFTPNIELKHNTLTTIQNLDGLGNIFENLYGYVTAPTAPVGTNTTQIATTAFVQNAVAKRTFSITFSWAAGVYAADAGVYYVNRENTAILTPTFSLGNQTSGAPLPFNCKIIGITYSHNVLASTNLQMRVYKVLASTNTHTQVASKTVYNGINKVFNFIPTTDYDTTATFNCATETVSIGFLNPTTSTGTWRSAAITILFQEL